MIAISVEIDNLSNTIAKLDNLSKNLKNFQKPLKKISKDFEKEIQENFDTRGRLYQRFDKVTGGHQWARRHSDVRGRPTEEDRLSHEVLELSGGTRRSFRYNVSTKELFITNTSRNFKWHQSSAARRRIPRRLMLTITPDMRDNIVKHFSKYIKESVE